MRTLIFLPTQGPHLPRRGPPEKYDRKEQCRLAASLQRTRDDAVVYVPSAFHQNGSRSELEFYGEELRAAGVPEAALLLDPHGLDTVEQCERAMELAKKEGAHLVAVTCEVQLRRVRYLLRQHEVEHVMASGTPSRWLQFTNIVLGVAFPILDALGLRSWWTQRVAKRRLAGKQ